ncbi:MAG: hypothetical protein ACMUIG_08755 [Thermoplasmatota archaeon]
MEEGNDWKKLQTEIDRTMERSRSIMQTSMERFAVCPNCSLPTFYTGDDETAFCANCDITYDRIESDGKKIGLNKRESRTNGKFTAIAVSIGAVFMLILAGLSVAYYLANREPDYISIYDISDIRGLDVKKNTPVSIMSSDDFNEYARNSLDDEMREYLLELERFYKCMLIIGEDWDLISMSENSTAIGILGFYDPDTKNLYIMDNFHTSVYVNYILSHEFTHALQDQNFDLEEYAYTDSYDLDLARMCVVEGDAVITMNQWADENLDPAAEILIGMDTVSQIVRSLDGLQYGESSPILSEINYFPYEGGEEFVGRIYDEGGWDAVDRLYTDKPPLSTEQILHYDKYVSYEKPEEITFTPPSPDLDLKFSTTAGEKLIMEMLHGYGMAYPDIDGDNGWSGDRFFYYEDGSDFMSVFITSWDDQRTNDDYRADMENWIEYEGYESEHGVYNVRGSFMDIGSSGNRTTVVYSSSLDLINQVFDH